MGQQVISGIASYTTYDGDLAGFQLDRQYGDHWNTRDFSYKESFIRHFMKHRNNSKTGCRISETFYTGRPTYKPMKRVKSILISILQTCRENMLFLYKG